MSEGNKQLGKRWFEEVWNKGRREAIAEMLAPDALIHEGESTAKGPEGFHAFLTGCTPHSPIFASRFSTQSRRAIRFAFDGPAR